MLTLPFFKELISSRRILIAGAGGGYDVFCGIPLFLALQKEGKEVFLANLSFSYLRSQEGERLSPTMLSVTADTPGALDYFPEKYLCHWFRESEGQELTIYAFDRCGVAPLKVNYKILQEKLELDTIILVDGGTDSLMRGNEDGLGTPCEDVSSILAADAQEGLKKFLVCLGFGVDRFHGVSNDLSLKSIAELNRKGSFLGMHSLLEEMEEVRKYREAAEYVFERMPHSISIVSSSILASIRGHYGDHHFTPRTRGSKLWINPLMSTYLFFSLSAVAQRILYSEFVRESTSFIEMQMGINMFQSMNMAKRVERDSIPD